jgi:hypothetical protein
MDSTHSDCRAFRESLLDQAVDASGATLAAGHAAQCRACALFAGRFAQVAKSLSSLTRKSAPHELEGRVVAALEAGSRQQRAIEALVALGRLKPPTELDGAVMAAANGERAYQLRGRHAAPAVLERLVNEELSDPPKARARRFVGSLRRFVAPRALEQRVSRELVTARVSDARPLRVAAWIGLAAVALIALSTPLIIERALTSTHSYPFRVEHINSLREGSQSLGALGADAHDVLDGLGGGILGANRI